MSTTLHIKNMVCPRCVSVVREKLTGLGLRVTRVELGEAEVADDPPTCRESIGTGGKAASN
ncbi:MAG: hypothetical protein H7Z75_00695 [Ferruginibacter sp.]|nr:hypothetical protein [Cytophagales bacterium]